MLLLRCSLALLLLELDFLLQLLWLLLWKLRCISLRFLHRHQIWHIWEYATTVLRTKLTQWSRCGVRGSQGVYGEVVTGLGSGFFGSLTLDGDHLIDSLQLLLIVFCEHYVTCFWNYFIRSFLSGFWNDADLRDFGRWCDVCWARLGFKSKVDSDVFE